MDNLIPDLSDESSCWWSSLLANRSNLDRQKGTRIGIAPSRSLSSGGAWRRPGGSSSARRRRRTRPEVRDRGAARNPRNQSSAPPERRRQCYEDAQLGSGDG